MKSTLWPLIYFYKHSSYIFIVAATATEGTPTATTTTAPAVAGLGDKIADLTYSKEEGEYIVITHLTPAPGGSTDQGKDGEHGRRLNHVGARKWANPNCDLELLVGDCHSNSGNEEYSAMLTDVVDRWNHIPENQDLTGKIFTPKGISFKKTTCDGDDPITCDNFKVMGRISSCHSNYGKTGWSGLSKVWYYRSKPTEIIKASSQVNEYYKMNNKQSQHVLCQEIGHGIPMGHQSETSKNLKTCMDYSMWVHGGNRYPNEHDVEVTEVLYDVCPSSSPVSSPTTATPYAAPTTTATVTPTAKPTTTPTAAPSAAPTATPSAKPTTTPTAMPSAAPTATPSAKPTTAPNVPVSATPTTTPTTEADSPTHTYTNHKVDSTTKQDAYTKKESHGYITAPTVGTSICI
jgi:hypothetical protein